MPGMKLRLRPTFAPRPIRLWALPSRRIKSLLPSWQSRKGHGGVLRPAFKMPKTRLKTNVKSSIILR